MELGRTYRDQRHVALSGPLKLLVILHLRSITDTVDNLVTPLKLLVHP